ncbi:hypothetical protein ACFODL_01715 [Phenylobacterium terrae]|uniref:Uncharacterized protein n=2 Tax=Phenylobacterium terrae TaxID=2665495 RepID=A0ABW4MX73_9CAUL
MEDKLRRELAALSECIVEDLRFSDALSTLQITINDVFDRATGAVRPNIEEAPVHRRLTCRLVEHMEFAGGLRSWGLVHQPELIGWSHAEVSFADAIPADGGMIRIVIGFGGERVLRVLCRHANFS